MPFIDGKVVIVTGGCSGIALAIVHSLAKNKAKGIAIVDCNPEGHKIASEINDQYKTSTILFVQADVSIMDEFKNAFEETIKTFHNVDILINNAGILNDLTWEKEIAVNLNGTIHGCLLALHEYMPKYKSSDEAAIINVSSTAGLEGYPNIPIYSATKHAIIGLGRSWGHVRHFKESKVRVMTICPNATGTPLLNAMSGRNLGPVYQDIYMSTPLPEIQSASSVADCVANMLDNGTNGSVWLVEAGEAYEVKLPDVESFKHV